MRNCSGFSMWMDEFVAWRSQEWLEDMGDFGMLLVPRDTLQPSGRGVQLISLRSGPRSWVDLWELLKLCKIHPFRLLSISEVLYEIANVASATSVATLSPYHPRIRSAPASKSKRWHVKAYQTRQVLCDPALK